MDPILAANGGRPLTPSQMAWVLAQSKDPTAELLANIGAQLDRTPTYKLSWVYCSLLRRVGGRWSSN